MMNRNIFLATAFTILLIGSACGQEWLEFYPNYDPGLTGMLDWLYRPVNSYNYPGPYGVYPFYPSPYYSDFRLNSLEGMNWTPFQKNWSETMQYAQTKSSLRVYPIPTITSSAIQSPAPITTQSPATTTGDSTATIVSQGMRGYQVFLDGNYIGTEGTGGDPLDGTYSFNVVGNRNHDVRVYDGQFNYPKTIFFERGGTKIIHVEPGTAIYIQID
jgi:hypothetical protein